MDIEGWEWDVLASFGMGSDGLGSGLGSGVMAQDDSKIGGRSSAAEWAAAMPLQLSVEFHVEAGVIYSGSPSNNRADDFNKCVYSLLALYASLRLPAWQ
jgi:hypothetical protein